MRRKIYLALCCCIVICSLIGLRYKQTHTKIDITIPTNAEAYLYIDSIWPSEKKLLEINDYPYLERMLDEIRYYNPTIDPADPDVMLWGGSSYLIELHYDDEISFISIGTGEIAPGIHSLYISESSDFLAAYISEEAAQEIESFFRKYIPRESVENDIANNLDALEPMPEMDIELENGGHVTGAVLVHEGKGYSLTEKEYHLLMNGADPTVILAER